MKKGNLEELISAAGQLPIAKQRILFEELIKNALAHHQLGMADQERQQLDEALEYYKKALAIMERLRSGPEAEPETGAGDHPAVDTLADLNPVEQTRGSMKGLDRETIIWLAEDEELCGY